MATGVPTPFVVVFHEQFDDCDLAERYVHTLLQQRGYRVADNREFFTMPVRDAVMVLLEAKSALSAQHQQSFAGANEPAPAGESDKELWLDVLKQAEVNRYGLGEALADAKQALRLYKQAAVLGSSVACLRIGEMYQQGLGCEQNTDKALDYFKEAARLGEGAAFAPMACLYYALRQFGNAEKCWTKYFSYLSDSDIETRQGVEGEIVAYVTQVESGLSNHCVDKIKEIFGPRFDEILVPLFEKERLGRQWGPYSSDVLSALLNLGYQRSSAERAIRKALDEGGDLSVELILRKSLRELAKG